MREFINGDCMNYLPWYPDDYFDLAIVDPPYGEGFTESGGCKGWFSKYHQDKKGGGYWNRFGQRFDRYKQDITPSDYGKKTATTNNEDERIQKTGKKS